ncbi:hypothetical protein Glove_357g41 [Diversispora epigaea]|uniref:Uncharacterized protein n=1 Tax=Diversispora epigaea TaxID=1348612 RepID=A0A397HF60_9GLOM|nr:hypothetical protein Glove_357g41 [Diversispora epigaea]
MFPIKQQTQTEDIKAFWQKTKAELDRKLSKTILERKKTELMQKEMDIKLSKAEFVLEHSIAGNEGHRLLNDQKLKYAESLSIAKKKNLDDDKEIGLEGGPAYSDDNLTETGDSEYLTSNDENTLDSSDSDRGKKETGKRNRHEYDYDSDQKKRKINKEKQPKSKVAVRSTNKNEDNPAPAIMMTGGDVASLPPLSSSLFIPLLPPSLLPPPGSLNNVIIPQGLPTLVNHQLSTLFSNPIIQTPGTPPPRPNVNNIQITPQKSVLSKESVTYLQNYIELNVNDQGMIIKDNHASVKIPSIIRNWLITALSVSYH